MCRIAAVLLISLLASGVVLAEELRDPTRPLDYNPGRASVELELNAILVGEGRRLAVINGQQLRENEAVANSGGIRLRSIDARSVVVAQDGKTWRLSLAGQSIRQSRSTEN